MGDYERYVGVFDDVGLSVMERGFDVGAMAELVVVAPDLSEVLAGEGVGEVVEELEGVGGGLVAEWLGPRGPRPRPRSRTRKRKSPPWRR